MNWRRKSKNILFFALTAGYLLLSAGCASPYLKGVNQKNEKVYLGPVPIEKTEAYQDYLHGPQTEVDEQNYLFRRLKDSTDLEFFHDGNWYNSIQAYRGGKWLMRERYQKGQKSRDFIRKYVERSEDTGQFHLVKYPDGSVHIGSYLLYNELDLLQKTAAADPNRAKPSPSPADCDGKCVGT